MHHTVALERGTFFYYLAPTRVGTNASRSWLIFKRMRTLVSAVLFAAVCTASFTTSYADFGCVVGSTSGQWVRQRGFVWKRDRSCQFRTSTRDAILRYFSGKHIALVGDSTTRLMAWELAMWGWGCGTAKNAKVDRTSYRERFTELSLPTKRGAKTFPKGLGELCNYGNDVGRWDRTPWSTTIPTGPAPSSADIRVTWKWTPYMWDARNATIALLHQPNPPDVIIVNNGFWHLRHAPRPCYGECTSGPQFGLANATARFIGELGREPDDLSSRVLWRGFNFITMAPDNDFSNAEIGAMEEQLGAQWEDAGYPLVSISQYTPAMETLDTTYTEEGYHPRRFIYRAFMQEVLDEALDVIASREAAAAPPPSSSLAPRASRTASRTPKRTASRSGSATRSETRSPSATGSPSVSESVEATPSVRASPRGTRSSSLTASRTHTASRSRTRSASAPALVPAEDGYADDDYTAHMGSNDTDLDVGSADYEAATHEAVIGAGIDPLIQGSARSRFAVAPDVVALGAAVVLGALDRKSVV